MLAVGSDLDGTTTQNWRQPQPPVLVAVNVDRADAAKSYRVSALVQARAGDGCAALLESIPAHPPRGPWADLAAVRDARGGARAPAERGFLDAMAAAAGDDAVVVADMCIPGYWLGGVRPRRGPAAPGVPDGLGHARASASRRRSARRSRTRARRSRCVATAASSSRAASWRRSPRSARGSSTVIVDDGGYGMLRWDQDARGDERSGVDLHTPDFVALARSFGVPAHGVEGLGSEFAERLLSLVGEPEPSVLVAKASLEPPPSTSPRWYRAKTSSSSW